MQGTGEDWEKAKVSAPDVMTPSEFSSSLDCHCNSLSVVLIWNAITVRKVYEGVSSAVLMNTVDTMCGSSGTHLRRSAAP
jgi:hypothetical protein